MSDIDEGDLAHTGAVAELETLREFARRVVAINKKIFNLSHKMDISAAVKWLDSQPGNYTTSEPTDEQLGAVASAVLASAVLGDDIRDAANCARRWWLAFRKAGL